MYPSYASDRCGIKHEIWKRLKTIYCHFVNHRKSCIFSVPFNKKVYGNSTQRAAWQACSRVTTHAFCLIRIGVDPLSRAEKYKLCVDFPLCLW